MFGPRSRFRKKPPAAVANQIAGNKKYISHAQIKNIQINEINIHLDRLLLWQHF